MLNQSISASNLSALSRVDLQAIADAAQVALRNADNEEQLAVLNSGNVAATIEYFRKRTLLSTNAIGLQKWYKEDRCVNHYLVSPFTFNYHPNSPVLMRGSIEVMAHKYGNGNFNVARNGLAYAILERYVKFYKITVTNDEEYKARLRPAALKLAREFNTSYHYEQRLLAGAFWPPHHFLLIRGNVVFLDQSNTAIIKSIYRHYKKLERVA